MIQDKNNDILYGQKIFFSSPRKNGRISNPGPPQSYGTISTS